MVSPLTPRLLSTITIGFLIAGSAFASTSYNYQIAGEASATITLSTNTITITLTDLYVNPTSVAQNLSAFWFTTGTTPSSASITSGSSTAVDVNSDGTYATAGTVSPGWALTDVSAVTKLDDLTGGANPPADTIIGSPGSGNTYSAANSSITGNAPHNPFLDISATWVLNEVGVTAATSISNVYFMFGTTENSGVQGTLVANPEPSTALMLAGGLIGAAFWRRRHNRKPTV